MSHEDDFGYIFSNDELFYLLDLMGVNYVVGVPPQRDSTSEEEIQRNLLNKGYVFKDIENQLILNSDISRALKPMAFLGGLISIRCANEDGETTAYFYTDKNRFTLSEVKSASPERIILSCGENPAAIAELITDRIIFDENVEMYGNFRAELSKDRLSYVKSLDGRTEKENYLQGLGMAPEVIRVLMGFLTNTFDIYSVVFWEDIKNKPEKMTCIMAAVDGGNLYKVLTVGNGIALVSVDFKQLEYDIKDTLRNCMNIKSNDNLFV